MVVDEIKRLSTMVNVVKDYYKNNIDKLIKNHEFIVNYKEKNTIGNFFYSLTNKTKKLI